MGWQPPIGRGRWRGALLQAPGHIFLIDDCKKGGAVAAQWGKIVKASEKSRKQREGPQSPVGRGRWGGALLQAGFEPAIYVTTSDDVNHYTTLPPILSL